jgi:hypothetical protein
VTRFRLGAGLTTVLLLALAGSDPGSASKPIHPKAGHYHGDSGYPVKFRLSDGKVKDFRIDVSSCRVYKRKTIPLEGLEFDAKWGPPGKLIHVYGEWKHDKTVSLAWDVGYEGSEPPQCLDHSTWKVHWKSPN